MCKCRRPASCPSRCTPAVAAPVATPPSRTFHAAPAPTLPVMLSSTDPRKNQQTQRTMAFWGACSCAACAGGGVPPCLRLLGAFKQAWLTHTTSPAPAAKTVDIGAIESFKCPDNYGLILKGASLSDPSLSDTVTLYVTTIVSADAGVMPLARPNPPVWAARRRTTMTPLSLCLWHICPRRTLKWSWTWSSLTTASSSPPWLPASTSPRDLWRSQGSLTASPPPWWSAKQSPVRKTQAQRRLRGPTRCVIAACLALCRLRVVVMIKYQLHVFVCGASRKQCRY